ncbi:MAG TPA: XrtA/PEP-CTERM system histidine kinase PrsK [Vicinamibacteria bacterium]|nr:XrtA/PEP-CTERM system histidine kinase PrsK [Vicinamibacteria bacterium]
MPGLLISAASLAAAAAALAMAAFLLVKARASGFHRRLAIVLAGAGALELGLGLAPLAGGVGLFWHRTAVAGAGVLGAAAVWLGGSLMGDESRARALARARGVWAISAVFVAAAYGGVCFAPRPDRLALTATGRLAYVALTLCLILALAQLETILRATREPLRYRIKFVLLGVGAMVAFRIYAASQILLFGAWPAVGPVVDAGATLVSLLLVAFGLARGRVRDATERVSISPQMIYGSITVLAVGSYLVAVGLLGYVIRLVGHPSGDAASEFVVFLAALALAVAASSRYARVELRRLVARHFLRSAYDYRTKWLEVTDAFEASSSEEAILDRLLDLLTQTFGAGRISVWLRFDADQRFHRVRAANTEPSPEPLDGSHPVVATLEASEEPQPVGAATHPASVAFLAATHAVLCVPIRSSRDLIAFIALSAAPHGQPYGEDDRDLLRAIARHVGVLLAHARLAEDRRAAAELEALHRLSAFCMHDLKNLAARLSLVTQNAAVHGDDPGFREAARRTVENTAREMSALIAKLSVREPQPGRTETVDVGVLLTDTLRSIDPRLTSALRLPGPSLPPVTAVKAELEQVVLNTILNARHALERVGRPLEPAHFSVTAEQGNGTVVVTVSDEGSGIPVEQLRALFQPLRTTKAGGLGIGLFESRRLIEGNHGRLFVESEAGTGTRVRIELLAAIPAGGGRAPGLQAS